MGPENWKDQSQRILNVMMPDTVVPIHKHSFTSESIIICRGKVKVECYAEDSVKISERVLEAGESVLACRYRWEFIIRPDVLSLAV